MTKRADEPAAVPVAPPSAAERQRMAEAEVRDHEARLALHAAEPREDAWATRLEQQLGGSLAALPAAAHAQLEHLDCRSHTCVATLSWPSRGDALGALTTVASAVGAPGCTTRLTLPEAGGEARYEASALFECGTAPTSVSQ